MADLKKLGVLDRSMWSYNTQCTINDQEQDNPLELDSVAGWRHAVKDFVDHGPYFCDSNDDQAHNDHRSVPLHLYHQSYCNLVIETLFDADASGGVFLTEKTFKAIKFGQPFVIIGTAHSLHTLRQQGYRVFDHVIDNFYKAGVADLAIVEDFSDVLINDDQELIDQAEDTMTILSKYIDNLPLDVEPEKLKAIMRELYIEAINTEVAE
jgi:hypothetical protein